MNKASELEQLLKLPPQLKNDAVMSKIKQLTNQLKNQSK